MRSSADQAQAWYHTVRAIAPSRQASILSVQAEQDQCPPGIVRVTRLLATDRLPLLVVKAAGRPMHRATLQVWPSESLGIHVRISDRAPLDGGGSRHALFDLSHVTNRLAFLGDAPYPSSLRVRQF